MNGMGDKLKTLGNNTARKKEPGMETLMHQIE